MFKNLFSRDQERDTREKKLQETVKALLETVEKQHRLIRIHEEHIKDIGNQNEELRKSITITPQQKAAYDNQTQVVIGYQEDMNKLAVWLRENKSAEIAAGKHGGMSLVDVILMYLGGTITEPEATTNVRPN